MAGPAGTVIGRLLVKVVPDTSRFRGDLKEDLATVDEDLTVNVGVLVNQADLKAAQAILAEAFSDQTVFIKPIVLPPTGGDGAGGGAAPPVQPPSTPGGGGGGGDGDGLPDFLPKVAQFQSFQKEVERFFQKIGGPISQGAAVVGIAAVIAASLSAIAGGIILLPGLIAAFLAPIGVLALTFGTFVTAFEGLSPAFSLFGETLNTTVAPAAERFVGALNLLAPILQGSANQLGIAFGTIVDAISAFISGNVVEIQLLFTNLAIAMEALAPFIGVVLDLFLQFLNFVLPFVPPFIEALTIGLQTMGAEFETIAPLIAIAISDFTTLFVGIITAIPVVIAAMVIFGQNARLVFELIGSVVSTVIATIMVTFNTLRNGLSQVGTAFREAGGGIQGVMAAARQIVSTVVAAIIAFFGTLATGIGAAVAVVLNLLDKFGVQGMGNLRDKIREGITNVRKSFEELPDKIANALNGLDDILRDIGEGIVQSFIGGVTSLFPDVERQFRALTDKIPDWKGPAERDRHLLDEPADLIMGGFVRRVEHNFGDVRQVFGRVPVDIESAGERAAAGGVQQTFMVDPRADSGFVEGIAEAAYRGTARSLNLRFGRV